MKRRAVFLDRDGVLNEPVMRNGKPHPPSGIDELVISPGTQKALLSLRELGFILAVVTNQPDVSRGTTARSTVEEIHAALVQQLPLDEFFTCFHDDADACKCRKPLPGLIEEAAAKYAIDVPSSYLIGDRWRDIEAGFAAGCRTIFVDRGYHERRPSHHPDKCVASLAEAARWIVQQEAVV